MAAALVTHRIQGQKVEKLAMQHSNTTNATQKGFVGSDTAPCLGCVSALFMKARFGRERERRNIHPTTTSAFFVSNVILLRFTKKRASFNGKCGVNMFTDWRYIYTYVWMNICNEEICSQALFPHSLSFPCTYQSTLNYMWGLSLMHIEYLYCMMNWGWKDVVLWRWNNTRKFGWWELTPIDNYAQKKIAGEIKCSSLDRLDLQSLNNYKFRLFYFIVLQLQFYNFGGCVLYRWKDIIFKTFPMVHNTPPNS